VVGVPISVVNGDQGSMAMAITPNGKRAYVTNYDASGAVSVIDTTTNQVIGTPIAVDSFATSVAITPDGKRAYVADGGGASVIDTATNQVVAHVPMVDGAFAIAISPDGTRAYAADYNQDNVSVIDTATNQVIGAPISVGSGPVSIAITPDGKRAYTANYYVNGTVSVIDTATNQVVGSPIAVGRDPASIAITPDGKRAYVANYGDDSVSVIDTATNQLVGSPILVGSGPSAVAITPDGKRAYVANYAEESVWVIDIATNQVIGAPILVGIHPHALAIVPDQPPVASFADPFARPGLPIVFSAAASTDPDGSIARYDWAFGDGGTAVGGGPSQVHTYAAPGNYQGTLTLTDNEGCSTALIFTGQTAYCSGSAVARQAQALKVAFPALRVKCPKRAGGRGCKFKLRAVTKRRKGRPETAVARAKVKAGKAAILSLKPKPAFAAKLASVAKILVKEDVTMNGSKKTLIRRLRVVG
jgi:YVTN family beta-propeller protein